MLEHYEIENVEQLRAIADLLRLRIIDMLQKQPMTVTQLGEKLGEAPAKVHYHVRELEKAGLLRLVETREKGGILEKYYQPIAREFGVEQSLLSAPPDEAIATMSLLFGQVRDGFLRTLRQTLAEKSANPAMHIGFARMYMTAEEEKRFFKQLGELVRPYEQPRGIEGEREILAMLLAYPEGISTATPASIPLSATLATQAVGSITFSKAELEKTLAEGKRLTINVVGVCTFADNISPDLAERAIEHLHLVGKLIAPPAVREVLMKKRNSF